MPTYQYRPSRRAIEMIERDDGGTSLTLRPEIETRVSGDDWGDPARNRCRTSSPSRPPSQDQRSRAGRLREIGGLSHSRFRPTVNSPEETATDIEAIELDAERDELRQN